MSAAPIAWWFDIISPYAWFALAEMKSVAEESGRPLVMRPVLLGGLLRAMGRSTTPLRDMPAAKRHVLLDDMARCAARAGLPWTGPIDGLRTVDALRCVLAVPDEVRGELVTRLFDAVWRERLDVGDAQVLQAVVARWGIDVSAVRADPTIRDALTRATEQAMAAGIFGVPTIVIEGEVEFGADRIDRVRRRLGLKVAPEVGTAPGVVTLFHDVASPYSYLGMVRAQRASREGLIVTPTPILLGAVFRAIGTPNVPLETYSASRRAWTRRDLDQEAASLGVPLLFPPVFPIRSVLPQRVMLRCPHAWPAIYGAAWVDGVDVGDVDALRGVLARASLDPSLVDAASDPAVKEGLARNTAAFVALGGCGVPTAQVGGQLVWGQDRWWQVEAALRANEAR